MNIIRPIRQSDFDALVRFAHESGHGFTSLPKNDAQLQRKIERSLRAFADGPDARGQAGFLFVMVDTDSGEVLGTSGIEARVGVSDALYHYHLSKVVHSSRELGIHNTVDVLTLCNDYTGASEICTLFLTGAARARRNGHLLSRFRFLFMAGHPACFAETVIAEMRGRSDGEGRSPFWRWLQRHFFSMDLADAVHRVGMGQKSFIAELMPHYPVYVSLLDDEAQQAIGQVHVDTAPALRLLEREGFTWRGYVDPFDAGPTIEARRETIATLAASREFDVLVASDVATSPHVLIANLGFADFRAVLAPAGLHRDDGTITMTPTLADALGVKAGDRVRAVAME